MGLDKAALFCLSLSFNPSAAHGRDNILVNNINSPPVELSFGFLSGFFLCLLVTGVSDTSSKGKVAIKCMCNNIFPLNRPASKSAFVFPKNYNMRCKVKPCH